MTAYSVKTNKGKNIAIYRSYTKNADLSSTQYLAPSKMVLGINNATPTVASTELTIPIPYDNGTVNDDGSNNFTGSSGGDNSTSNTSIYKEGAGVNDATAQNLIANDTNATKIWTLTPTTSIDESQYIGLWIYIKDSITLAKFKTSGTCLEIKLGSDSSNYYSITKEATDLSTGWNWVTSNYDTVADLTETGTTSGAIDTFIIEITTNNATDTFSAGDVVYDLLRTWVQNDKQNEFVSGYPSFDYSKNEVTIRVYYNSAKANGFDIDSVSLVNLDTVQLTDNIHNFTAQSKSSLEEFVYIIRERIV